MILSMQSQLATVTGQLTSKAGIYLFIVFFLILSKKGLKTLFLTLVSPLFQDAGQTPQNKTEENDDNYATFRTKNIRIYFFK